MNCRDALELSRMRLPGNRENTRKESVINRKLYPSSRATWSKQRDKSKIVKMKALIFMIRPNKSSVKLMTEMLKLQELPQIWIRPALTTKF
jgi:hypothetical protein